MGQEREPQLQLLSYESRRQAVWSGLAILLRRASVPKSDATGQNGASGNHNTPKIKLLDHEPRRKVLTGGLATLLRKSALSQLSISPRSTSSNGHHIPTLQLLSHEPRRKAFRGGLKSLFLKRPQQQPLLIGREEVGAKDGPRFTALFSSCLLHFSILFFLLEVPFWFLLPKPVDNVRLPQIVYEFHEITLPKDLPSVKPPGKGGAPGKGTHPEKAPVQGSSAFHHSATVVSNPAHPDNDFQTIIQPHINPARRIKVNLRLPNLVLGGAVNVSAPTPELPPPPMKLSVPKTLNSLTIPQASVVSMTPPNLRIPASNSPNMPAIPAPPPPPPPKPQPKTKAIEALATLGIQATANGAATSLLSLSLNPAPATKKLVIPAGNRYGAFTISPAGNHPGAPTGYTGGSPTGGSGGPGKGGNAATGTGPGYSGGGGAGAGASGLAVSTSGNPGSAGTASAGRLSASMLAKMVFPILRPPPKNRFAMVVTAGPLGGGGLHVFGVLKGGKIYTIFLPMPGKNWILQYSTLPDAEKKKKPQSNGVSLQINFGLVPPAVDKRFDFRRPPLTAEEKKKMIILHGIIGKDGSVRDLTVYRGVQRIANQAAAAAFAKWRFQAAVKSGKPEPIEILLGIPLS